jgi:hypothetical protein
MNALLKKDVLFKWDDSSMKSFINIKEAITWHQSMSKTIRDAELKYMITENKLMPLSNH